MQQSEITLIQAYEQFWDAVENNDRRTLTSTGQVYAYLVHIWNGCGRPTIFRRQNNLICAELCISKPTLDRHRQVLKNSGLINFFSKGKGDANITYQILDYVSSKKILLQEVKKVKNFTTPVTTPVTSPVHINIEKEKELFIVIEGEVKNFYYLKDLFGADVGLKYLWSLKGFNENEFEKGVEIWVGRNYSKEYPNFNEVRNHFLNWMPNYHLAKQEARKQTNGAVVKSIEPEPQLTTAQALAKQKAQAAKYD